jgi:histidinol-phosphatase
MPTTIDLDAALHVALDAVRAAGSAALPWHGRPVETATKEDQSPVTAADRAADAAAIEVIHRAYPEHDLLSEESGARGRGACDCRWVLDPLDGTRGFLRGDEEWGPLLALEFQGEVVVAAATMPLRGVAWWARRGGGAFRDGERIHVSTVDRWNECTLNVGFLRALLREPWGPGALELVRTADRVRGHGSLASAMAVAEGRADAWIEAGVREWDLAAPRLILEEAGGRFSDLAGRPSHAMGHAVGTNARLHGDVLAAIRNG